MNPPRPSLAVYLVTWAALLGLLLATSLIGLANLGTFNLLLGLVFAAMQASLLVLVYMHVIYDQVLIRVCVIAAVIWILIMMTLTLNDYHTRGWLLPSGK